MLSLTTTAESGSSGTDLDEPRWSVGLNPEQRAAVDHDGGPLVIQAGAGTGKTATLVARLARLLDEGLSPERILLVTFSRRAAQEMLRRVGGLTDAAVAGRIHAGTFHAVAHRTLRRHGRALGLGEGFTVLDQADATDLVRLVRADVVEESRTRGTIRRFPRPDTVLSVYSRVVNTQVPLEEAVRRWYPWCAEDVEGLREVFSAYHERKRCGHLLDFDDLLLYWRAALADPSLGPVLAGAYDHVLVDEYQDTNIVQADILARLRSTDRRLTVVGDDAQAIYSFRAATVRNLLDFTSQWPGATTVALEHNYRSTQPVLDLANAVVAQMGEGSAKRLWADQPGGLRPVLATCPDEAAQADAVCDTILEHYERGCALRSQAVLFRTGHHSDLVEVELRRRRVPFVKYGGLRFLEAAHVRDLAALLRVLDNPWDEMAWPRVLGLAEGVGPAASRRLLAALGVRPRRPGGSDAGDRDPLDRFIGGDRPAPGRALEALRSLAQALDECRSGIAPGAQVERLRLALDPIVRHRYDHAEVRLRDLDQLAHLAAGAPSRAALVADMTLDPPASTSDLAGPPHLDDDYVVLSTVHSAKGGEWDVVHVIHAADGMFPSDMATGDAAGVDEERRLFYVALTRARRHLHIYAPLRYHHGGPGGRGDRHSFAQRTRFLPPDVDSLLEHRAVRTATEDVAQAPASGPVVDAVGRDLGGLW